jgi:hypothetical protein
MGHGDGRRSAALLFFVSFLMTTMMGSFAFQMFAAVLGSGWFVMRVKSPRRAASRPAAGLRTASIEVDQAAFEWRMRTSAVAQAFADKRERSDHFGGLRRPPARLPQGGSRSRRQAAAGRRADGAEEGRAALLSSMEKSLQDGLTAQAAATEQHRWLLPRNIVSFCGRAAPGRGDGSDRAPFPKWAA